MWYPKGGDVLNSCILSYANLMHSFYPSLQEITCKLANRLPRFHASRKRLVKLRQKSDAGLDETKRTKRLS